MRLLLISIPKASTNILTRALLSGYTNYHNMESAVMGAEVQHPRPEVLAELREIQGLGRGHLVYHPVYVEALARLDFRVIFLYRDLRDALVSQFYWALEQGALGFGWPAISINWDFARIIDAMIEAAPEYYGRLVPWINVAGILPVRYEDILLQRRETMQTIADHLADSIFLDPDEMAALTLRRGVTFRNGSIGDWVEIFTQRQHDRFWQLCEGPMNMLGYQRGDTIRAPLDIPYDATPASPRIQKIRGGRA